MKYLFIPFWRLFMGFFALFMWAGLVLVSIIYFLWTFKSIGMTKEDFYIDISDDETSMYIDPDHVTTTKYYKNPWHALLGKISTRTEEVKEVTEV